MSYVFEKIVHQAGARINGVTINVDIVNACCLSCPSCAVGSIGTKRKGIMSIETFRRVLDKAQSEMKIRLVRMYTYSDALMHKDADLFFAECTKRGLESWSSTMLQVINCDLRKVIEARPKEFRISFPGFEQMSYYQSKAAHPDRFRRNFAEAMKLPRHPETVWTLMFHRYNDNGHEVEAARKMAEDNGLKFVDINAIFMPLELYVEQRYSPADHVLLSRLIETPEVAAATMRRTKTCRMWYKELTLDANADTFLCELVYEERFKIGNYFHLTWKQIQSIFENHSFCGKCLEMGANELQNCYAPPAYSDNPALEANKKRRIKV